MIGTIVFQNATDKLEDKYIEIVLRENGRARLIQCTKAGITVLYRAETTKHGRYEHTTSQELGKSLEQYEEYKKLPDFFVLQVSDIRDYNAALIALAHATRVYEIKPYFKSLSALFPDRDAAYAAAMDCEMSTYCITEVKLAAYAF